MTNAELIATIRNEIERLKKNENELIENSTKKYGAYPASSDIMLIAYQNVLSILSTLESEKPRELGERIASYNIVPYIDDKIAKLQDMWREEKVSFDWDDLKDMIEDVARHFAKWGAEHLADARKIIEVKPDDDVVINGHKLIYDKDENAITVSKVEPSGTKDLEEAAIKYADAIATDAIVHYFHKTSFIAGAKWQNEQDEEEQADLFTIVALDAAQRAKEQMMQEAVEGKIYGYGDGSYELVASWLDLPKGGIYKDGQKVRVIICKKED